MKSILLLMMIQSNIIPVVTQPLSLVESEQSQSSSIEVKIDDVLVMQKIGIDRTRECTIQVDSDLHDVKVFVDDNQYLLEQNRYSIQIPITIENKELSVIAKDENDQEVHRWIEIEAIQIPSVDTEITDKAYILNDKPSFQIDRGEKFAFTLSNQETNEQIPLALDTNQLTLNQMGDYLILYQHKDYPYIQGQIVQFFYTDQKPKAQIETSINQNREGVNLSFMKSDKWIQEAYIEIQSPKENRRISFTETVHIDSIDNQDFTTKVKLVVKDLFGQISVDEKEIRLDRIAPDMRLKINGQLVEDKVFIFDSVESLETQLSEETAIQIRLNNGTTIRLDELQRVLNQLLPGQTMSMVVELEDEYGNKNLAQYQFQKNIPLSIQTPMVQTMTVPSEEVEKKKEEKQVQSVTTKNVSLQEYQVEERVYSLNDDHEVVMQQRIIAKKTKPTISVRFFSLKDQSIKVLVKKKQDGLKNKVVWIKVNGEKIELKKPNKDDFGNMIYEIPLKQKRNKIEVKVVNEKGYTKRFEKIVEVSSNKENKLHWYDYFFIWLQNLKSHFMYE